MEYLTYDGSFEGFLTVVFECYSRKISPIDIGKTKAFQEKIFVQKEFIATAPEKAERVWKALQNKLHKRNKELPLFAFLSEAPGIEIMLYRFVRRIFDTKFSIETDFGDPDVLELKKLEKKVMREAMRVLQFVRFQKTQDDIFFSGIEPQYDVLPFSIKHFTNRFADQRWLVYDLKRDYGIYYDLKETHEVALTEKSFNSSNGKIAENLLQEGETTYQALWKDYFDHINITERKNLKLQRQHMPQRFWKFLPEKGCNGL